MTSPSIHYTTNYGIAYADVDLPAVALADVSYEVATTLDAALGRGGIAPPDATTQAQLAARITALEAERVEADRLWVDYTPRMTGGTGFAEGATTGSKGRYHRVGTIVTGTFYIVTGAGFAQGTTSTFGFTLPVTARTAAAGSPICGTAWMWKSGGNALGALRLATTTAAEIVLGGNAAAPQVGPASPWAWAAGMEITGQFTYEAAPV